jgi:serine/threonine protein kinase
VSSSHEASSAVLICTFSPISSLLEICKILLPTSAHSNPLRRLRSFDPCVTFVSFRSRKLSVKQILKILLNVSCGINHINMEGYVYRDLALRNVLIDYEVGSQDYRAVVADLGWILAKDSAAGPVTSATSTAPWRITAPEALGITGPSIWSESSDVWSYVPRSRRKGGLELFFLFRVENVFRLAGFVGLF